MLVTLLSQLKFLKNLIKQKGSNAKALSDEELEKLNYNDRELREIVVDIPCYTQRIDLAKVFTDPQKTNSAKEKNLKNVLDLGVRSILTKRVKEFKGDFKKAFSDLEKNPIWLNEAKAIAIKRVTISGVKNAEFLHYKKDHLGKDILDKEGNKISVDFVSSGENHHIAIYRDEKGDLQDNIVTFFDAVRLGKAGEPIVDKTYNQGLGWQLLFSMKKNEYFVFPNEKSSFNPMEVDLLDPKNKKAISPNLFRVQSISKVSYGNTVVRDFIFRHHLDATKASDLNKSLQGISYHQYKSLPPLDKIVKVRLNHLGELVKVGEY